MNQLVEFVQKLVTLVLIALYLIRNCALLNSRETREFVRLQVSGFGQVETLALGSSVLNEPAMLRTSKPSF